jgi:hypothetical protein
MQKKLKRFHVEWSILSDTNDKEWPQKMVIHARDDKHARKVVAGHIILGNKFLITNVTPL